MATALATRSTDLAVHPLAELVPAMSDEEYRELRDDIEANGLQVSITLYEGKVLDGRHRARACEELGIEPGTTEYAGESPAAYVWSLNGVRRNLDTSQRSMVAAKMLEPLEEEARKRQGQRTDLGQTSAPDGAEVTDEPRSPQRAAEEAAILVGASPRSVMRAKRVRDADPELAEEVAAGKVTVTVAEKKVRESSSGGLATKVGKPPEVKTERQRQVAEKNKVRVEKVVGTCNAFARGLSELKVEQALAVATPEEVQGWDAAFREAATAINQFRKRLKEAGQ